jgi:hypothetical protein
MRRPLSFRIDAPLPPRGPARWATVAGMVIGGAVALLVPVVMGLMLWELWAG